MYAAVCLLVLGIGVIVAVQWLTRPTEALMPAESSAKVKVDQASYRLYQSSGNDAPGAPLATDNAAATLTQVGSNFRMRVGVENKDEPVVLANQFSSGYYHACVIASDNKLYCWGRNHRGQLGNNSMVDSSRPVAVNMTGVLAGKTIKQMSVGTYNTCVIASDDKVYCWGSNAYGQVGNNSLTDSNVPVAVNTTGVLAGKTIKQISVGHHRACAIASDDKMYCWGNNMGGALGNGSTADSHIPVSVNMSGILAGKVIRRISIGAFHTCVYATDNKIYCWGSNNYGQLGNNSTANSGVPVATYIFKKENIPANAMKLRAQYVKKATATCQAVAAGGQDVTNNSALAYSASGPNNGTAIAVAVNDPILSTTSVGYSHQSIVRPGSDTQLTFTIVILILVRRACGIWR